MMAANNSSTPYNAQAAASAAREYALEITDAAATTIDDLGNTIASVLTDEACGKPSSAKIYSTKSDGHKISSDPFVVSNADAAMATARSCHLHGCTQHTVASATV